MEKLLHCQVLEYLQTNGLLYEHQAGLLPNHSTVTQLFFLRDRRKSSQKLAKRRTCVWGGRGSRPFSQSKLQKKKKKNQLHVNYVRSPTLRKGAANKSSECVQKKQVVEEFSEVWMILVTVRDRRRIENLLSGLSCAPAVPRPRDSRTSRAEATSVHCCRRSFRPDDVRLVVQRLRCYQQCRAVGDTARFVQ